MNKKRKLCELLSKVATAHACLFLGMRHGLFEESWWGLGSDPALFAVQPRLPSGGLPQYRRARVQVWRLGQSNLGGIFLLSNTNMSGLSYGEDIFHLRSVQKLSYEGFKGRLCSL